MSTLKYSRQRESIKLYLAQTKEHPTADMVYTNIRKKYPNISLGTVYRNLNLLVDQGEVIKISSVDGSDRFDAHTTPHYHLMCMECSNIFDLNMEPKIMEELNAVAGSSFDGEIYGHDIIFHGKCEKCSKKQEDSLNE